jgi:hypothetical protein
MDEAKQFGEGNYPVLRAVVAVVWAAVLIAEAGGVREKV